VSDVTRTAGSPTTFPYYLRDAQNNLLTPASNPLQSIHASSADAATGANPLSGPTALTGAAGSYTCTYPSNLAAGTYYLRTTCSLLTDVDDRLILQSITGSVSGGLASLQDVKRQLGKGGPDGSVATADDAEIQISIDAATCVIERIKGPIIPRTYTLEQHNGRGPLLNLDRRPVMSVASVTEYIARTPYALAVVTNPSAATAFSCQLDLDTGTLTRLTGGGTVIPFAYGEGNIQVTYTAGRAAVPPEVRLATMRLIQFWWQPTQQGARPDFRGGAGAGGSLGGAANRVVPSYAVPNFVYQLLEGGDGVRIPGIA
jgi:hypothetical protein